MALLPEVTWHSGASYSMQATPGHTARKNDSKAMHGAAGRVDVHKPGQQWVLLLLCVGCMVLLLPPSAESCLLHAGGRASQLDKMTGQSWLRICEVTQRLPAQSTLMPKRSAAR